MTLEESGSFSGNPVKPSLNPVKYCKNQFQPIKTQYNSFNLSKPSKTVSTYQNPVKQFQPIKTQSNSFNPSKPSKTQSRRTPFSTFPSKFGVDPNNNNKNNGGSLRRRWRVSHVSRGCGPRLFLTRPPEVVEPNNNNNNKTRAEQRRKHGGAERISARIDGRRWTRRPPGVSVVVVKPTHRLLGANPVKRTTTKKETPPIKHDPKPSNGNKKETGDEKKSTPMEWASGDGHLIDAVGASQHKLETKTRPAASPAQSNQAPSGQLDWRQRDGRAGTSLTSEIKAEEEEEGAAWHAPETRRRA